jgi:hypothetical protein
LIRFGRKSQRTFGAITQLVESRGKAAIDDNEQLVREIRSGFAAPLCIQVLGSGLEIPFARNLEEAQNRASGSGPPENIWRRNRLSIRGGRRRDNGLGTRKKAKSKTEGN